MSFDDIVIADAALFDDPDGFPGVESVVITFQDRTTRTVNAPVFRGEPVPFGDGYRPGTLISFRNDATYGMTDAEIDGGGVVTVTLGKYTGATPQPHQVHRCTDPEKQNDSGRVWVECG